MYLCKERIMHSFPGKAVTGLSADARIKRQKYGKIMIHSHEREDEIFHTGKRVQGPFCRWMRAPVFYGAPPQL